MNHWADPSVATNALSFDMIYHVSFANVLINLRVKPSVPKFANSRVANFSRLRLVRLHTTFNMNESVKKS